MKNIFKPCQCTLYRYRPVNINTCECQLFNTFCLCYFVPTDRNWIGFASECFLFFSFMPNDTALLLRMCPNCTTSPYVCLKCAVLVFVFLLPRPYRSNRKQNFHIFKTICSSKWWNTFYLVVSNYPIMFMTPNGSATIVGIFFLCPFLFTQNDFCARSNINLVIFISSN